MRNISPYPMLLPAVSEFYAALRPTERISAQVYGYDGIVLEVFDPSYVVSITLF